MKLGLNRVARLNFGKLEGAYSFHKLFPRAQTLGLRNE